MLTCLLAAALAAAPSTPAVPKPFTQVASVEGVTQYNLPNGLKVLFVPDPSKATVTVNMTIFVGSRHEGYGEKGMAHLLEHLLFKGTQKVPDAKKAITEHGARANGTTWFDRTNYFETMPATDENLRWALEFEADRLVNSRVDKKDLDPEMTVVRNEFEMGENDAQNVLLDRMMSTHFSWHNYGNTTIGAKSDIELVPIERLKAFYARYYQPDNTMLVVAGKFDEAKAFKIIANTFGKLPKGKTQRFETYTQEPVQDGERSVTVRRTGGVPLLASAYHVAAGTDPDFAAIDVLTEVLGSSPSGRLYKALVEPKKAASVGCMNYQLKEPGVVLCYAELQPKDATESAKSALLKSMEDVKSQPITAAETERARAALVKQVELTLNTSDRVGINLSEYAAMGDWRMLFLHRDRIKAVKTEDVQRVAEKYFKATNRTFGDYVPTEKPDRTEVPALVDVAALVKDYKGDASLAAGEAFAATPQNIDSRVVRSALPNGMKVAMLSKKTRGQTVRVAMTLRYGTLDKLKDQRAATEFAGKMLSRGTQKRTRQQFNDELDKLKARLSFAPRPTSLMVTLEVRKPELLAALDLIAEALMEPAYDTKEFETLKREIVTGLEQDKSEPQQLAFNALQRTMAPYAKGHPFYVSTYEELIQEDQAVTLAAAKDFHAKFYGGQSGELAIVGDFEAEQVMPVLTAKLGQWKAKEAYERIPEPYRAIGPKAESIATPDKANATMGIGLAFSLKDSDPDYAGMVMADYLMGGGFLNGRIPQRLREKEGLSYGAGTWFRASTLDDSAYMMGYAIFAPQNLDKIEAGFKEEFERAAKSGFTNDEISRAKLGMLQEREQRRANDGELAQQLISQLYVGRTMAFDAELEKKLKALTAAEVSSAFKKHVDPSQMVTVKAGDFKKLPASN